MTISRTVRLVSAAAALTLSLASAAWGNGGSTIASAPDLPLDQIVVGGGTLTIPPQQRSLGTWFYQEFYRLNLTAGDQLTIDWETTNGRCGSMAMFDPSVTDYTVPDEDPASFGGAATTDQTCKRSQLRLSAPSAGPWTLYLYDDCLSCYPENAQLAYSLTAHIRHLTRLGLRAFPTKIRAGRTVTIRGTSFGLTAGTRIVIRFSGSGPTLTRRVTIGNNGAFRLRQRLARRGTYRVNVTYAGDDNHLPSAVSAKVQVARKKQRH